ncbi:MAG: SPOR domain-containing protein, partial [Deltaproteobacteria bacterium]|nr:SPOR domain-containing protein [Deltaproteobacteria bacterium]
DEIDEQRRAQGLETKRQREAALHGLRYMVHAAVTNDEAAARTVTQIIDLGFDAILVSTPSDTGVLLEVRVGPFDSTRQAESALTVLHRSMHLDPYLMVVEGNWPAESEGEENVEP